MRAARALAAVFVALTLVGAGSPSADAASGKRWTTKPGVEISPAVREKLDAIAELYWKKTKRTLLVTSGTRSPERQAAAMYGKLRAGSRLFGYRNQPAIEPLRKVYDEGRRKRWSKAKVVAGMAEILADQCARGVYISRHLRAGAFDVRVFDMTVRQKRAFVAAVREVGGVQVIEERRPPHFHCELLSVPLTPGEDTGDGEDAEE